MMAGNAQSGHAKGLAAEKQAAVYLKLKGYSILQMRYKTPQGEVDIVARRGRLIVFVEVKLRAALDAAAEAIHPQNQHRVRQAAALYLAAHPEYTDFDARFDALLMAPRRLPRHIENAF
ncbi:MAG: YraN family protein [Alphaproteobacteria bacterium]|nr:YraN family protein [Alphaproteobacteria bacterium]